MEIGKYNTLKIIRKAPPGMYLGDEDDNEVLLPNRYIEDNFHIGDELTVFVYCDSSDLPVATTEKPKGIVDEFVCLKVKETTNFGAFLDWGLSKDVLVPFKQQLHPMKAGKEYVVRIYHDTLTNRIAASSKLRPFLRRDVETLKPGEKVECLVSGVQDSGFDVIANNRFQGFLPVNSKDKTFNLGDTFDAYILRLNNGSIDVSLTPSYRDVSSDVNSAIVEMLKENAGFLPYHDKSNAEEIRKVFNMSKKNFKKAIGYLYKKGEIDIQSGGIKLK